MIEDSLNSFLILRKPAAAVNTYKLDFDQITQDQEFLGAIFIAAPQFYKSLLKNRGEARIKQTTFRYFNRYCFRPTPFGLFSAITPMSWQNHVAATQQAGENIFVQADNRIKYHLDQIIAGTADDQLEPNPSLYRVQLEYRFIRMETNAESGKRTYLLQATDYTAALKRILKLCEPGQKPAAICEIICQVTYCDLSESLMYLDFLKEAQILLPVKRSYITGVDHFTPYSVSQIHAKQSALNAFSHLKFVEQCGRIVPYSLAAVKQLRKTADQFLTSKHLPNPVPFNIIRLRDGTGEAISECERKTLGDGLYALSRLSERPTNVAMESFIRKFELRFEGQTVSLLNILDTEIGIGYQESETDKENTLLETLALSAIQTKQEQIRWNARHQLLLNAWHRLGNSGANVIELTESDLQQLPEDTALKSSGYSVLFRTNGAQVWVESAGGYHTNALAGRFTLASEVIRKAAIAMAAHEQQINPDILFAEILHLSDLSVDNVNRRSVILPFEIPITAASSLPKNQQLALKDLFVTVVDKRVILTSFSHHKVVLPRLSSAYNHQMNELPLFRFLADIPYQFSAVIQHLDLSRFFPGLEFYPRVIYRQAILAQARWILARPLLASLVKKDEDSILTNFKTVRERLRLPEIFALIQGDQQLIFHAERREDVLFFVECVKNLAQAELQEVLSDLRSAASSYPVITSQYNAFVEAKDALGLFYPSSPKKAVLQNKRRFMPGSEWLYLKIYTTRLTTDLILKQIAPYLKKQIQDGKILKWFFVRYEDHAPHIRLRLLVGPFGFVTILSDMRQLFESKVERQVIREFQIDTYNRELERYGMVSFEEVELFFWSSSELILKYITSRPSFSPTHLFALASTKALVSAAFSLKKEQADFYHLRYQQLRVEFKGERIHVELDKKYRSLRSQLTGTFNEHYFKNLRLERLNKACVVHFANLILQARPGSMSLMELAGSLVHMHLNRLFVTDSRKQEMAIYYLLFKYTTADMNRSEDGTKKFKQIKLYNTQQ